MGQYGLLSNQNLKWTEHAKQSWKQILVLLLVVTLQGRQVASDFYPVLVTNNAACPAADDWSRICMRKDLQEWHGEKTGEIFWQAEIRLCQKGYLQLPSDIILLQLLQVCFCCSIDEGFIHHTRISHPLGRV